MLHENELEQMKRHTRLFNRQDIPQIKNNFNSLKEQSFQQIKKFESHQVGKFLTELN